MLDLFAGLPWPVDALFWAAFVITVTQLAVVLVLIRRSLSVDIPLEDPGRAGLRESDYLWVFLVPALNEEVTIADTIARLEQVQVTHRAFVVIDDGSTDATASILAASASSDLCVLTRVPPEPTKGKAATLNNAWSKLAELVPDGVLDRFGVEHTLVVVVDADGRLDLDFARTTAPWFADPQVGGVQLSVRIYNRSHPLAWCQDLEFRVFGTVFQLGRTEWGTAGMGGNGQVNRLAALNDVAVANAEADAAVGPWRDRLTEDEDLGLSLLALGWRSRQNTRAVVHQQGLSSFRRLFRQRVRWSQGNMQAMARIGSLNDSGLPLTARFDANYWLLQPVVQFIIGVSTLTALVLAVFFTKDVLPDPAVSVFVVMGVLAFGGTTVGVLRAWVASGGRWATGVLIVPVYTLYIWSLAGIYPVATWRQLRRQTAWAKTAREAIGAEGLG